MIAPHSEHVVLAVCGVLTALSAAALWALRKPNSRLSKWLDDIDPGDTP